MAKENATIIAVDKNEQKTNHSAFKMDITKSENIHNVVKKILALYEKPPSIIVNCAGITMDSFMINMSEDSFDKVIDVNLKGTYLITQHFAKLLLERNITGSIVNVGSIIGKIGNIGQCNYAASKAGVELITKTAAKEFGRYGIRCNVVLPGFIQTPMVETVPEKVKEMFSKQIGLKRLGQPEEVAEVITFLASDKSSYVNGASIEVTGGGL
ncbi:predicted protein [Pediculus humanus corporis]|uniref:(3R)-3-hydroxyacyl-CoA dehydrogenase n=1 Tax=Pediculus humanus subsp. corporis TaxID=121224 RepID=E0VD48_PEDHC|nr:uncharacterized protein Phum_PHUM105710 [Pediculus humanus corporis]EEB11304.1 predicted protein [Pediculus humanus corporis]